MENITALYEYHYDEKLDGIVIDKYKGEQEVVTIPGSFDGLPVTAIGSGAFSFNMDIVTVTLPDSITSIGDRAFDGCDYLNEINIPKGITSIEKDTFHCCWNLSRIDLPDSITFIGENAFQNCRNLREIDLPDSITFIGESAFYDCHRLTSIHLPGHLTSISNYTFTNCHDLTEITIPDSVTSIGSHAFSCCNGFKNIILPDSIKSINNGAFSCCCRLKNITIPDGTSFIDENAFDSCSRLTITYKDRKFTPSDLEEFYPLFWKHPSIKKYHYEEQMKGIVIDQYGDRETSIDIPKSIDGRPVVHIGCMAFFLIIKKLVKRHHGTSLVIPDSVVSIGNLAFFRRYDLVDVTIPDSVTYIGDYAFSKCYGLTHVTLPDSVTYIGKHSFRSCGNITVTYKGREYNESNLDDLYALSDTGLLKCLNHDFLLQDDGLYIPSSEFVIENPKELQGNHDLPYMHLICKITNGIYTAKYLLVGDLTEYFYYLDNVRNFEAEEDLAVFGGTFYEPDLCDDFY